MDTIAKPEVHKAVDGLQSRLADYACGLAYEGLTPAAVHAVKVRVIDTLGALIGGFFGEPCRIARDVAAQMPNLAGATVLGTRMKAAPDMAAFANATTSRYLEANDIYYYPGGSGTHPSDVITPVYAAAEHAQASGRDFITAVALAYEIHVRFSMVVQVGSAGDTSDSPTSVRGFDYTNFVCLGSAAAAGKLYGLTREQLAHCIAMAVVPNVSLQQSRSGALSMYKAVATGQAGRGGVFAALLARAGMEGPHLPFEGKAGWCDHVAKKRFALDVMGGVGTRFMVEDTWIKHRYCCANAISSILAAEKVASALGSIKDVQRVLVEVDKSAKKSKGSGEHNWNPTSRETADHSIPYGVAAALVDGRITPGSYDEAHVWNPELCALMQKIEVVANDEYTRAHESLPVRHCARVTVTTADGRQLCGESGGDKGDLTQEKSDAVIEEKFREFTEEVLGAKRVSSILDRLWHLEELRDVGEIAPAFALD